MAQICEDAPCCGCCGTNIYGVYQGDSPSYWDGGPPDEWDEDEGEDEEVDED